VPRDLIFNLLQTAINWVLSLIFLDEVVKL
jgi:hypothetical protein